MEKLFIKNMVCNRCILVVEQELKKLDLHPTHVGLGEVTLKKAISPEDRDKLAAQLESLGFEIIDDRKSKVIESIKTAIIRLVHHDHKLMKTNLSDFLQEELNQDYGILSALFSAVENVTIEKYYIAQKIERVKELLVYDELTIAQIADQMNYSSAAYLSNQFKKVTGLTPGHFKKIRTEKRKPLDGVR